MADIQNLQEKVQKAEEKVVKCKGTIERHQKQLEKKIKSNVEDWEIKWKQEDIKGAERKLRDAEIVLENWKSKLNLEVEKERFMNDNAPQVIKDFLEEWKTKAYEWHIKRHERYQEFKKEIQEEVKQAKIELEIPEHRRPNKEQELALKEKGLDYKSISKKHASFGVAILHMDTIRNEAERLAWLEKTLEAEKKAKMLDLIVRINNVVGTITDASHLRVSEIGNLNGFIIGEKAKAKIETIGAGGWNIQCFHYRTLINEIK